MAAGARQLWVLMEHTTKDGTSKLVHRCSYPLTAVFYRLMGARVGARTRIAPSADLGEFDLLEDGVGFVLGVCGLLEGRGRAQGRVCRT